MKKAILILLLFNSCFISAQSFLNGDFEINLATTCLFNLSNTAFNSSISNSIGFGGANELDIQQAGASCAYSTVPSGISYISLATSPSFTADALSLELSAPLVPGNSYMFCYYEQANTDFFSPAATDSLEIGLSTSSASFGTRIYSSRAVIGAWTRQTVSFIAPNNGSFITVRNQGHNRGWNFIDAFAFNCCPEVHLGADTVLCSGQTLHLDAGNATGSTFIWQDGSGGSSFNVTVPGTFWVNASNGSCNSKDTIVVNFAAALPLDLGSDTSLCTGQTLMLNAATASGESFLWQDNSTSSIYNISGPGIYFVTVNNGICAAKDSISVNYIAVNARLGNDTALCTGQTLTLSLPAQPGEIFLWQGYSVGPTYNITQSGIYWVNASVGACSAKDTINVSFKPLPFADLGNDRVLCANNSIRLDVTTPGATYLWQDGSGSPVFTVDSAGTYWVRTALNNCYNTDTIKITEADCDEILTMPNVFSPNKDGVNDAFSPLKINNIVNPTLKIYNRWGEKLVETTDLINGWNGTYNGTDSSDGVYYWIVNYTESVNNTEKVKTGFVTLIR